MMVFGLSTITTLVGRAQDRLEIVSDVVRVRIESQLLCIIGPRPGLIYCGAPLFKATDSSCLQHQVEMIHRKNDNFLNVSVRIFSSYLRFAKLYKNVT